MQKLFKLLPINLQLFGESYISLPAKDEGDTGSTGSEQNEPAVNDPQPEGGTTEPNEGQEQNPNGEGEEAPDAQEQSEVLSFDLKQLSTPEARRQAFSTLKEKFKDEFSEDFQQAFNRRFKNHKDVEQRLSDYEPLVESLMEYHGVNDVKELQKILNEEIIPDLAEKEGFQDPDKYIDYRRTKKEASQLKQERETREAEEKNRRFVDSLIQQGQELKKLPGYEELDLARELDNPEIVKRLNAGYSLRDAYDTVHRDQVLQKQIEAAVKNQLTDMKAKGQKRIPENGYAQGTSGVVRVDVSKLTDKQIEEYNERVSRGEKIQFI